jgi:hypothetical protein
MWATCPLSVSSGYHAGFHEGFYQKHTNPLNCRTSSLDISGYHADFSRRTWHCRRIAWVGHGRGTAWAQHGMCELALNLSLSTV